MTDRYVRRSKKFSKFVSERKEAVRLRMLGFTSRHIVRELKISFHRLYELNNQERNETSHFWTKEEVLDLLGLAPKYNRDWRLVADEIQKKHETAKLITPDQCKNKYYQLRGHIQRSDVYLTNPMNLYSVIDSNMRYFYPSQIMDCVEMPFVQDPFFQPRDAL